MFVSSAFAQGAESAAGHATSEHAAKAAEHAGGSNFPPFDSTYFASHLFWLIICFGLFYIFIARVAVPRIGSVIENRRDRIASDLDQAARMKQEADAAVTAYEKELSEARARGLVIAQAANDEAKAKADNERKIVEASLEEKLAAAEKRIGDIKDRAMQDVGQIAADTAQQIVQDFIGSETNAASLAKAVKSVSE